MNFVANIRKRKRIEGDTNEYKMEFQQTYL